MGKVAVPAGFGQTLGQQQPRATPLAMLCWAQATAAKQEWGEEQLGKKELEFAS